MNVPAQATGRDIAGFPGYRVTTDGRVQSAWAPGPRRAPGDVWRDLVQCASVKGYRKVTLCGPGVRKQPNVHRLVAEAFIPNPDDLPCVRHLDGDPANNAVENLAWGTYLENEHDKKRHGTWDATHRGNPKLTRADRDRARALVAGGATHTSVAIDLGVCKSSINRLIAGFSWRNDV